MLSTIGLLKGTLRYLVIVNILILNVIVDVIIIVIITRPWPAFGRQGLVGSLFEYSYTRLASRLRRSARSGLLTLGKDKTPSLL